MKVAAVVSTKGGPGKTTVGANLGAFCADAGLRTLLIDLDTQPSLSSFYTLTYETRRGNYQLIANDETRANQVISKTCIPNLSLIHSNDPLNQLGSLLLHAADGRFRLKNLIPAFAQNFDLILVDTGGRGMYRQLRGCRLIGCPSRRSSQVALGRKLHTKRTL